MNTCLMLRNSWGSCWDVNVPCSCTHGQCYATAAFLAGMFRFLALAHMFNATRRAARVNALGHSPADFLNLNNDSKWIYK